MRLEIHLLGYYSTAGQVFGAYLSAPNARLNHEKASAASASRCADPVHFD
jgi:hypothetical protein